jgi:hypothetical protein
LAFDCSLVLLGISGAVSVLSRWQGCRAGTGRAPPTPAS